MMRTILVVDHDAARLSGFVAALEQAGYAATGAQTFPDASKILSTSDPSVLIANVRLGAYNGLHLLLRGQAEHPRMHGIIIGPSDGATEREALAIGASIYLAYPVGAERVVAHVARLPLSATPHDMWHTAEASPSPLTLVSTPTPA